MEVERQLYVKKEDEKLTKYSLSHSRTWECEGNLCTSYLPTVQCYLSTNLQHEVIKVEEMEQTTYGHVSLVDNVDVGDKTRVFKQDDIGKHGEVNECGANTMERDEEYGDYLACNKTVPESFTCNICNRTYSCIKKLKNHMWYHNRKKIFGCEICEKRFISNCDLRRHKLIHSGDKPYGCDICGKRFVQK